MSTADAGLTAGERARLIQLLRDSEAEFVRLMANLTEAQWTARPAAGRWSVQQIAEHIVVGEKATFTMAMQALAAAPDPEWQEANARKTQFIEQVLPNRRLKAMAPDLLVPQRGWTCAETIARFQQLRAATVKFVEEIDRPLKDRTSPHPFPVFGALNALQWLLYIPLHNMRHNQQIAETLRDLAS
ncbi:MAG TPA: DinB family protein [Bryobacteraceae bacterium]|nr:DinB family protein [Bryobacteraceae bacterium]